MNSIKIQEEIVDLEKQLEEIPAPQKYKHPLFRRLVALWNLLHPEARTLCESEDK
jgi:hypothetical protein